jgi:tetratricopeptide (TPR) repeat protein
MTAKLCKPVLIALSIGLIAGCATSIKPYERTVEIAAQYQNQRSFELAEKFHRMALDQMRADKEVSVDNLSTQMTNVASVLTNNGPLEEAESLLFQALALQDKKPSPSSRVLAHVYSNLGRVQELQGRLASAEDAYSRSMALMQQSEKWLPIHYGFIMAGLADIYARKNEIDNADAYHSKAKDLYAATLGESSAAWLARAEEFSKLRDTAKPPIEVNQRSGTN